MIYIQENLQPKKCAHNPYQPIPPIFGSEFFFRKGVGEVLNAFQYQLILALDTNLCAVLFHVGASKERYRLKFVFRD